MEEEIIVIEDNDIEEINIEEENYYGKPYKLPIASKDVLGGIKVGENLTIDEDGTLNANGGVTSYNDLTDKPTIPTKTSELTNDSNFISTIHVDYVTKSELSISLSEKANTSDIPTKLSQLTNDSNFLTEYQPLKTINNQSIIGTGNIEISGGTGGTTDYSGDFVSRNKFNIYYPFVYTVFNAKSSISGKNLTVKSNGSWAWIQMDNVPVTPNKEITLSYEYINDYSNKAVVYVYDKNDKSLGYVYNNDTSGNGTITFTPTTSVIKIRFSSNNTATSNTNSVIFTNIQIDEGPTATSYVPYFNLEEIMEKIYK